MKEKLNSAGAVDIFGVGLLLPKGTPQKTEMALHQDTEGCPAYLCLKPVGKDIFNPRKLRRLGHSQKMALVAAHRALEGIDLAGIEELSRAVSVGTGLGETGQTAGFLEQLIKTEEKEPAPIKFINSVHNSIAGQLAIQYGFQGENHTFSHSSISFELALWQARVLLLTGRAEVVLGCGVDEANPYVALVGSRSGWWQDQEGPLSIPGKVPQKGTLLGEGAGGLLLGRENALAGQKRIARLALVRALPRNSSGNQPFDPREEVAFIAESLHPIGLFPEDLDLVLLGANGDGEGDGNYEKVMEALASKTKRPLPWGVYKHLSGEFHTASAIGTCLAVQGIKEKALLEGVKILGEKPQNLETILVYHLSNQGDHSVSVIQK